MHKHASVFSYFLLPAIISAIALVGVWAYFGSVALVTALLLVVLEITLSFDNAVVNARMLERMTPKWQKRFLTWGIFIAVFLTRAVLPVLIVSASVMLSPKAIAIIAFLDPTRYAVLLQGAGHSIASFGGIFLTMVGLKYFFDTHKEVHWIDPVEKRFAEWGSIEAVEIAIALTVLGGIALFSPLEEALGILFSGIGALIIFIAVQGISHSFSASTKRLLTAGLGLFIYLNILDIAFSLDSVIGAFALSTDIPIIVIGLGIGAYFVRALTLYMVHHGTLTRITYIEHGAHWAVLGLAGALFTSIFINVPEPVTGLVGFLFIGGAYLSSLRSISAHKQ